MKSNSRMQHQERGLQSSCLRQGCLWDWRARRVIVVTCVITPHLMRWGVHYNDRALAVPACEEGLQVSVTLSSSVCAIAHEHIHGAHALIGGAITHCPGCTSSGLSFVNTECRAVKPAQTNFCLSHHRLRHKCHFPVTATYPLSDMA